MAAGGGWEEQLVKASNRLAIDSMTLADFLDNAFLVNGIPVNPIWAILHSAAAVRAFYPIQVIWACLIAKTERFLFVP